MKRIITLPSLLRLTLAFFIAVALTNCTPQKYKESTDETLNMTDYLRQSDEYSMFLEILDITNYAAFMNTYGTYTMFVPTNDAVQQFLTEVGASSLNDVPLEVLQDIAKMHILDQKINTTSFTDGKIATPTLYGQFLISGAANNGGITSITINKTSNVVASNVEVGNGVIHVIDKVLRVADKTLAQTIEADPSLSLFTEALKATGWYDALNKVIPYEEKGDLNNYLTVLAQSDEVFQAAGFNTIEDLKERYSHLGDPMNPQDSLNLFVSYRILPKLLYLADIVITPALETKAPLEVISTKLDGETLKLNEDVFNGVLEEGVSIIREFSDVTAANGVLHLVDGNFAIKKRIPAPVYFDFTDQPEFSILSIFRGATTGRQNLSKDQLADIDWTSGNNYVTYVKDPPRGGAVGYAWHGDVLEILRLRDGWCNNLSFKTPVIIKGKYKVWISFRAVPNKGGLIRVFFDGVELSRQINNMEYGNTSLPERVLESQGYKRHIEPFTNRMNSKLAGTVDVATTGRHTITLLSTFNAGNTTWLDVCEFRPVEMDQLYPKFESGGDALIDQ